MAPKSSARTFSRNIWTVLGFSTEKESRLSNFLFILIEYMNLPYPVDNLLRIEGNSCITLVVNFGFLRRPQNLKIFVVLLTKVVCIGQVMQSDNKVPLLLTFYSCMYIVSQATLIFFIPNNQVLVYSAKESLLLTFYCCKNLDVGSVETISLWI